MIDYVFFARVGHASQKLVIWRLSCQSQSCQSVHNQVDPQHLHSCQRRVLENYWRNEGHEESHNVDCKLELQELADTVEDVSAVLDSSNDRTEVVVKQNYTSGLLGYLSACLTHSEPDICVLECGCVVGAVSSHSHHIVQLFESYS